MKSISEIVQDGNKFKVTVTTGSKVLSNEFTIGEECEMELLTGEKVKVSDQLPFHQGYRGSEHCISIPAIPPVPGIKGTTTSCVLNLTLDKDLGKFASLVPSLAVCMWDLR